jgi:hypothetical protein
MASASGQVCTAFTAALTVSGGVREAHSRTRSTSGPADFGPSMESTTIRFAVTGSVPGGGGAVRFLTNSSCSSFVRLAKYPIVEEITMPCTRSGAFRRMRGVICPPMLWPHTTLRSPPTARSSCAPASATTSKLKSAGSGESPYPGASQETTR